VQDRVERVVVHLPTMRLIISSIRR
jgi:hypothetical protein